MKKTLLFSIVFILILLAILLYVRGGVLQPAAPEVMHKRLSVIPIEVAPVEYASIEFHRTFSGTLDACSELVVAPKIAGRVKRLTFDIADSVRSGQIIGQLDDKEYIQLVALARADLAVAKANQTEALNALKIAQREFDRIKALRQRGVASDAQLDKVEADILSKKAALEVAQAEFLRAEAALETAKIQLSYTQIVADWNDEDQDRVVAERFVDEGNMVGANDPLLRIVALNPLTGVFYVAEQDYGRLHVSQTVSVETDAFYREKFAGKIARIAPVFLRSTRQARVELKIENKDQRLKPGMFIRVTVVLERKENVPSIPLRALTHRQDQTGVFLVSSDKQSVIWTPVTVGIRSDSRVEIKEQLDGEVVTLGQKMLKDGAAVTIPAEKSRSISLPDEVPRR